MKLTLATVHSWVNDLNQKIVDIAGKKVEVTSVRLQTFATKGTDCICCGAKGSYYKLDYNMKFRHHLNLYAVTEDGSEVLMTRDHEICHSHGGPDTVENMNPMCKTCNQLRGNKWRLDEFLQKFKEGHFKSMETVEFNYISSTTPELIEMVEAHLKEHGADDPLIVAFRDRLGKKKWKEHRLLRQTMEAGDALGEAFLKRWICASKTIRKNVAVYYSNKYIVSGAEGLRPEAIHGMLDSQGRRYRDNPTAENAEKTIFKLQNICKLLAKQHELEEQE